MLSTHKLKEKVHPTPMVSLLNQLLANTIDLRLSLKQAHWNIKGEGFIALHDLFDKVSAGVDEYADMLAERAVQLGGVAQGELQTVSCQSSLSIYPADINESDEYIKALSAAMGVLSLSTGQAINRAVESGDMVTADVLTQITRGLDKYHWLVRSHVV